LWPTLSQGIPLALQLGQARCETSRAGAFLDRRQDIGDASVEIGYATFGRPADSLSLCLQALAFGMKGTSELAPACPADRALGVTPS
jgi:hypothetical protein